ncbi:MAG: HAD-IIA family hydrolase [Thiocapsa sp.]|jgi:HAD superfamily hydrolase (TIGR01450 family)|nr:HAD-IIA family hydrolase [Thiocapsa sp.]MCG6896661.1 HAD-IIA family hydrolase [Thiocapsa sp.]MCG6984710.1 HAD-IIA family hydrolase [Thiocapsa sp.]
MTHRRLMPESERPQTPDLDQLIAEYDCWLLDAYGVLLDDAGALPGAVDLLRRLDAAGKPWLVVTNSASRLPETLSHDWAAAGIVIDPARILTSGSLLAGYFAAAGLSGARCLFLGPPESRAYVERAGGQPVQPSPAADTEVVVVADQKQVRWPEDLDDTVSLILRRVDAGRPLHLLLCNPDLIYPVAPGRYGFTAGGIASMLEAVIRERYPTRKLGFTRLGKPYPPLFERARERLGSGRLLMVGDQLGTDIQGAVHTGIDSLLVCTGLAPRGDPADWPVRPTWVLPSLAD